MFRVATKDAEKGLGEEVKRPPFLGKIKLYSVRGNSWQEVITQGGVQPDLQFWRSYGCTYEFIFSRQAFIVLMRTHVLYCGALF